MQPLWIRVVVDLFGMLGFATISWLGLFRTHQVQRWIAELSRHNRHRLMYSEEKIQSPGYLWELRFTGLVAGIAALIMIYTLIRILGGR